MKKKINLRKILWYIILALPLLAYLFALLGGIDVTFVQILEKFAYVSSENSVVGQALYDLFSLEGIIPSFNSEFLYYFQYFIGVELLHIVIDVILFIPKFLQKCWERLDREKDS